MAGVWLGLLELSQLHGALCSTEGLGFQLVLTGGLDLHRTGSTGGRGGGGGGGGRLGLLELTQLAAWHQRDCCEKIFCN